MFSKRKKKIFLWILPGIGLLAGVWELGDFVYSRMVQNAVRRFESSIDRDEQGVQTGARSYTLAGNDTALLLVHGFNDTPRTFERMAPALHRQGFTVRAIRLPGFGVPVDQMHQCTCEQWVQTLLDNAHELRDQKKQVIVVGHSLGGAVTLGAITRSPELFDAAVLLAPAVDVANNRSPLLPTRVWRRLGDLLLQFSNVYQSPYDRNDCRDPEYRNPEYKYPFSTRNIVQQTFRLMDQNLPAAESIKMPVLMILSRDDRVTDWVAAEKYFGRIGSADKQLKFYDESGHALAVDYDWHNITADILEFAHSRYGHPSAENGDE